MATASGGACDDGGEQDDSSSYSDNIVDGVKTLKVQIEQSSAEDELSMFRQQWQKELESTSTPTKQQGYASISETQNSDEREELTDEEKAKKFFLLGVELERNGKMYEAIQQYKRAMQLEPDIEIKLYQSSEFRGDTPEGDFAEEEVTRLEPTNLSDDEDAVEGEDLLARFQRILAKRGVLCESALPVKGGHISWLPYEVLQLILRWVVSSELDATSLERVAGTCRGLYVAARDSDLWRALCVRTWGIDCGTPRASNFASWRQMYVERPRLHLHGCYISKTTYIRHGENSYQDQSYRPWYLIDYYRYLRFFPDGVVLSWTTADEPAACVAQLRHRPQHRPGLGIITGHYRLMVDKVVIVLKKTSSEKKPVQVSNTRFRARRKETTEQQEQIFHLELQLRTVRSRRNWQLAWSGYSVSTRRDQWTQFDLSPNKFPPFAFSRVRAYTAEAAAPLLTTRAYT